MTRLSQLLGAGVLVALLAACERSQPAPRNDTVVVVPPPPETTVTPPPVRPSTWDATAGPALLVPGEQPDEAVVVLPDFIRGDALDTARFAVEGVQDLRVELFARGRVVAEALLDTVAAHPPSAGCAGWPTGRLVRAGGSGGGGGPLPAWGAGFEAGRARAIPLDSIEQLSSADSARLVADIARLASALPLDTADGGAFRGIPFVVRSVRRFGLPGGSQALVADVVRKLSMEANPRHEDLFLIAERDGGAAEARWTTAYSERTAGPEETLTSTEVVAAVLLGASRRVTLVLAREGSEGSAYALVERTGRRTWRVRWTSAMAAC